MGPCTKRDACLETALVVGPLSHLGVGSGSDELGGCLGTALLWAFTGTH